MRKWTTLTIILVLAACQPDAVPESPIVRTDSAGVEVVQTNRPRWDAEPAWTVDPAPEVRVGLLEGELPYLFSNIAGVVVLADGTIVVADGQSREVRFFDRSGQFLSAVGGEGEGPGSSSISRRSTSVGEASTPTIYGSGGSQSGVWRVIWSERSF